MDMRLEYRADSHDPSEELVMILNKRNLQWAAWLAPYWLAAGLAPAAATPSEPTQAAQFDAAMLHLERCQWPQALERFALLADAGHEQAARIALLMHSQGTRLFGGSFAADGLRRQRWLDAAVSEAVTRGE